MNTANLQLEGLYLALAAIAGALQKKNLLTEAELESALASAENAIPPGVDRTEKLSPAHLDAIRFPLRFLRLANRAIAHEEPVSFSEIAAQVGRTKEQ